MKIPPPATLWWVLSLATLLLFVPLPLQDLTHRWPALLEEIENSAHAPLFAALTIVALRALRSLDQGQGLRAPVAAATCGMLFGALTECLQSLVGRDASWVDLRNDSLGVLMGIAWPMAVEAGASGRHGASLIWKVLASGLLIVVFWPLLWTVSAYFSRSSHMPTIWRQDVRLLQRFSYVQKGRYPGLILTEVPQDWRPFVAVELDLQSETDIAIPVSVRAHDAAHNQQFPDRFNTKVVLQPRERRVIRISIEQIRIGPKERTLDLSQMRGISVFQDIAAGPARFRVFEIRLAAEAAQK